MPSNDNRPTYPVARLIVEVLALLRANGVETDERPAGMMHTASIAAADLLRALGVVPVSTSAGPR